MRRVGIIVLVVCAVLAAGSAAAGLARAASRTVSERFEPLQAEGTPTPSYFVYLPLVMRDASVPGWTAVVEEGFETEPGSLWIFWDSGGYRWAPSTCRPHTGSRSAWAIGGGAGGAALACGSNCPGKVDSWMAYGPFSLADATAADLSFYLWLNVGADLNDGLRICASLDGSVYDCRQLTYEPTDWGLVTFPLDDELIGFNLLGTDTVWVALEYRNAGTVTVPEGAYVDDIVIRKCTGGPCQNAADAGAQLSAAQTRKVKTVRIGEERRLPAEQPPLR